jgi:hypothetical protein
MKKLFVHLLVINIFCVNTYCFSIATVVTPKPLNITFVGTLLVLFYFFRKNMTVARDEEYLDKNLLRCILEEIDVSK